MAPVARHVSIKRMLTKCNELMCGVQGKEDGPFLDYILDSS